MDVSADSYVELHLQLSGEEWNLGVKVKEVQCMPVTVFLIMDDSKRSRHQRNPAGVLLADTTDL